jgi:hypothetical protein
LVGPPTVRLKRSFAVAGIELRSNCEVDVFAFGSWKTIFSCKKNQARTAGTQRVSEFATGVHAYNNGGNGLLMTETDEAGSANRRVSLLPPVSTGR